MPTFQPPYAAVLCSVNGGTAVSGTQVVTSTSDTIQFSDASGGNWQSGLWEIYDYPPSYATPSGWTLNGTTGAIQYNATSGSPNPPVVTMQYWGKLACRLTVNQGIDPTGVLNPVRMVDTSCALTMLSPNGLKDMFAGEGTQFGGFRAWVGDHKSNLRIMESIAGGYMHIPVWTINANAGGTIADAGPANVPAYITEVTGTPGAAFIVQNGGAGAPSSSGFWTIVQNQTAQVMQYCVSPATGGPNIGPGQSALISWDNSSQMLMLGPFSAGPNASPTTNCLSGNGVMILTNSLAITGNSGVAAVPLPPTPVGVTSLRVHVTGQITTAAGADVLGDPFDYRFQMTWKNIGGTRSTVINQSGNPEVNASTVMSTAVITQNVFSNTARILVQNPAGIDPGSVVTYSVTVEP